MRLFEILIILANTASVINLVFVRQEKILPVLLPAAVLLCIPALILEKYRGQMLPAYGLSVALLVIDTINRFSRPDIPVDFTGGFEMAILLLVLAISVAWPLLFPVINLPEPGGKYPVGTMRMAFTDKTRSGIFTAPEAYRKLAVQVWYPAERVTGIKALDYFPDRKVGKYMAKRARLPNIFGQLALVKTNSYPEAVLSSGEMRYPVLLFSAGYGGFGGQNILQMEELASHGYVVFSIFHTYEDFASIFPDGEIIPCSMEQIKAFQGELIKFAKNSGNSNTREFYNHVMDNSRVVRNSVKIWTDDAVFTADQIEKLESGEIKSIFSGRLDTSRLGVFGHSFGGAAAGQVCLNDARFKAFINMDGTPFGDTIRNNLSQPFLLLNTGKYDHSAGYCPEQKNYLNVSIQGSRHADFMDYILLYPVLKHVGFLGSIDGRRLVRIVNDYVLSFFNRHLKGMKEPLADGMLEKYPEVTVKIR